jgi:hypothetical protein
LWNDDFDYQLLVSNGFESWNRGQDIVRRDLISFTFFSACQPQFLATSSGWREVQKMISPRAFLALPQTITKTSHTMARHKAKSRFVSTSGSKPSLVPELWNFLEAKKLHQGFHLILLLWTLCFIKLCASEETLSSFCGCDEKTFREFKSMGSASSQSAWKSVYSNS